jgi:hypothetical protein
MRYLWLVLPALLLCGQAQAKDGFDGIKCGGDIAKDLVGRTMPAGTASATEDRHKDISLKDLGADEISDNLNSVSWQMCGGEYMMLVDSKDRIRDAIAIPAHSAKTPEFSDMNCKLGGKDTPYLVVAILRNDAAASGDKLLPATTAWRIDKKAVKFVPLPVAGLTCPASGIITTDGGH